MRIFHYLNEALLERKKEKGKNYSLENDKSFFPILFQEIKYAIESWHQNTNVLFDLNNLNIDKLKDDEGRLRKPVIYTVVGISQKGNLILEWYPYHIQKPHELNDWKRWDNQWYFSNWPFNRILMIKEFDALYHRFYEIDARNEPYKKSFEYLIEAIYYLLNNIYSFLQYNLNVIKLYDLRLIESGNNVSYSEKTLDKCEIYDVEKFKIEEEKRLKREWLEKIFDNGLKISVEEFIKIFKQSNLNYSATARIIQKNSGIEIKAEKTKRLIEKLKQNYSELYEKTIY